ncbi:MAG: hypothetical protein IJD78_06690 [Clostridia bacterium]|nr:hypothetical protein [Clostridia bacterium]MBQ3044375.1 hypothetical protein [Clostridia bacterium]
MNEIKNSALREAYERLYHKTPLGFYNCGRLCDGLCCRGDCQGMWLYPGEEELFIGKEGFEVCETEGNYGYPMVICSGECNREERPLACRIFPLFPLVTEVDGKVKIEVIYDPRATMCPIAKEKMPLDRSFIKEVRKAALYLVRDEKMLEYMKAVSEEIADIIELRSKLEGVL